MIFDGDKLKQPLVDAAFLCHALLRAPNALIKPLEERVRRNLINALNLSKKIEPHKNNWVLFSAMVETGLYLLGAECDYSKIDKSVKAIMDWYKGDGFYGDGVNFHCDYYNSFVIHPMLLDIVKTHSRYENILEIVQKRSARYAVIQERQIGPDGYYPFTGRSICYRFGAFQLLAQAPLQHSLGDSVHPAQVRCALTEVMSKMAPHMFDESGWLQPGLYGYQPNLAERYINTGSLYLCSAVFLPLGLPSSDDFWSAPNRKWTSQRIVSGENLHADAHLQ
jgi:hypothetical protein